MYFRFNFVCTVQPTKRVKILLSTIKYSKMVVNKNNNKLYLLICIIKSKVDENYRTNRVK